MAYTNLVNIYLANGGKVTKCPPVVARGANTTWQTRRAVIAQRNAAQVAA